MFLCYSYVVLFDFGVYMEIILTVIILTAIIIFSTFLVAWLEGKWQDDYWFEEHDDGTDFYE